MRDVQELPSERDANFRIRTSQNTYVFKVANSMANRKELEFQDQMLVHLNQTAVADGFLFPNLLKGNSGKVQNDIRDQHGDSCVVRLVEFVPGIPFAKHRPHCEKLVSKIGRALGHLTQSLTDFDPRPKPREFDWDLARGANVVREKMEYCEADTRALVERTLNRYEGEIASIHKGLRCSVIHNDANDYNLIVHQQSELGLGLIDFGDCTYSQTVNELSIALAYLMLDSKRPLETASQVVGAYHQVFPLLESELQVLLPLACMRLSVSLCMSAAQSRESDDPYLLVTSEPAKRCLQDILNVHPRIAEAHFRHACHLEPIQNAQAVRDFLGQSAAKFQWVLPMEKEKAEPLDLHVGSTTEPLPLTKDSMRAFEERLFKDLGGKGKSFAAGGYLEPRQCYLGDQFAHSKGLASKRTVHLGLDLFAPAGTPIFAPLDGTVESFADNAAKFDYGPTIILRHETNHGLVFFTLFGHLDRESIKGLEVGQSIRAGEPFASMGELEVNGNWPSHLHFQVITDLLGKQGDFPGVADPDEIEIWKSICPDPNLILGLDIKWIESEDSYSTASSTVSDQRRKHLSPSLSLSYDTPIHMVRGRGQYLVDHQGRSYLDMVNNVCHVGHSNPRVVDAISKQAAILNTNTRYLHRNISSLAQRITSTLPPHLEVCFFVNSGSEANDLALRLARNYTKRQSVICLDGGYHGHLTSLIEISPYKFNSRGGKGCPPQTWVAAAPDPFRGKHRGPDSAKGYLQDLEKQVESAVESGRLPAAIIAEPIMSCGGQIVPPAGYLANAFELAKANGAVTIADEVQIGFARVGESFWGFQAEGACPDIVTMGKPIANGHPMGAVVTTREIADAFNNGMEYFNTFGGNPVSTAAALAVLDEIAREGLQQNAQELGTYLIDESRKIANQFPQIGDVRGRGLFIGIEFNLPGNERLPDPVSAKHVVREMKRFDQILLSTDGPDKNVIKIKPPMVIEKHDVDFFLERFSAVCEDLPRLNRD